MIDHLSLYDSDLTFDYMNLLYVLCRNLRTCGLNIQMLYNQSPTGRIVLHGKPSKRWDLKGFSFFAMTYLFTSTKESFRKSMFVQAHTRASQLQFKN